MTLSAAEVARLAGVNAETIRFYERSGLLPKPLAGARLRKYPPDTIERVRFVKRVQEVGFSLQEAKELIALYAGREHPCNELIERLEAKIAAADEKMNVLKAMKKELAQLVSACRACGPDACQVLEDLHHQAQPSAKAVKKDEKWSPDG